MPLTLCGIRTQVTGGNGRRKRDALATMPRLFFVFVPKK